MNEKERELAREARNAYARAWRKKNPDKVRKNNENYWLRKGRKAAKTGKTPEKIGEEINNYES